MKQFSMAAAWSAGFKFFAGRGLHHALILIGLGLLVPMGLQLAIGNPQLGRSNPAMLLMGGAWTGATGGVLTLALGAMALSFVLQSASYFASLRLGLRGEASLGGATLYGVLCGILALASFVLIGAFAVLIVGTFWSPAIAFLLILIILLPLLVAAALFYTAPTVLLSSMLALFLALAMLFGAATGQLGMAATMTGGSGGVAVLLLVLSVVTIWLAARFSCAASLMADRRSLNLLWAMRESWRLTWDEQWAITRYLALLGLGFAVLLVALSVAVGYGAVALWSGGGWAGAGIAGQLVMLALQIPFAFLFVMVPAGIYREVAGSDVSAEIFA